MIHHLRKDCRACGAGRLRRFLTLGPTPLANAFLKSVDQDRQEPSFPLDVYYCEDCSLVQLLDVIDPQLLFQNYIYVTGTSDTIAKHNVAYAETLTGMLRLSSDDLVVEVASNDGSLLKCFQKHGVRILGVEPATNLAEKASAAGIDTVNRFFDSGAALDIRRQHGTAKAVIGNNVFAHVDDPRDFLQGCKSLLATGGLVVIEVPYLRELLDRLEYDTVYHEHLCYFSVSTLLRLCEAVGLSMVRLDHVPVHGGSLRMYAGAAGDYPSHAHDVVAAAEEEKRVGMTDWPCYEQFAGKVHRNRRAIRELLLGLEREGHTVAAYGAPAKGNTLLNYCGITTELIPYTVDKNPMKVGLLTPGTHIPVLPVETLLQRRPDYVMILAWNFADEIIEQQSQYRAGGGRFIIPIPEPRIV